MNYTRAEFNGFLAKAEEKISLIQTALTDFEPHYPIALADLGTDITSLWDTTQYWRKKEPITRGLNAFVDLAYVTSRTVGETNTTYDFNLAIDELVSARQGKTSLVENLNLYSLKADLITNINTLSGTINKTRQQAHDHNDTTLRNATGAHGIADITGLTGTLSGLSEDLSIIADINLSAEVTKILPSQIQTLSHTTNVKDKTASGAHPISAITGLQTELDKGTAAKLDIVATKGTSATLLARFECIFDYILALDPTEAFAPPCWISRL